MKGITAPRKHCPQDNNHSYCRDPPAGVAPLGRQAPDAVLALDEAPGLRGDLEDGLRHLARADSVGAPQKIKFNFVQKWIHIGRVRPYPPYVKKISRAFFTQEFSKNKRQLCS